MNFNTFWSDVLSGILVVGAGGIVAAVVAWWITRPLEERRARRERDKAAADDFYAAYGGFFAAWKAWAAFKPDAGGSQKGPTQEQWMALLARASDAEGALESFLLRLTLERRLSQIDVARLWCFRQGYKQLRYAVRDGRPLGWRRSSGGEPGDLQYGMNETYIAFKELSLSLAAVLVREPGRGADAPSRADAHRAFELATATYPPPNDPPLLIEAPEWATAVGGGDASWRWVVSPKRHARAARREIEDRPVPGVSV
jgi:hypothetical protein